MLTRADLLFERFCIERNIVCSRIPTGPDQTPDYEIRLGTKPVEVEVKQMEANEEDRAFAEKFHRTGRAAWWVDRGRARQSILDAIKQLRAYAKGRMPTIVLLYDTIGTSTGYLDSGSIAYCLYGPEQWHFAVGRDPGSHAYLGSTFGGGRVATLQHNTTLSAVAVLREPISDQRIELLVYHNTYAALPLLPEDLRAEGVRHFMFRAPDAVRLPRWQEA